MRKLFFCLSLSLCIVALLCSCEKEPILSTNQSSIVFDNMGGSLILSFVVNKQWTASSDQSWCKVSQGAGDAPESNNASITVYCDANNTYDSRTCKIEIRCEELKVSIPVTQDEGNGLVVTQSKYTINYEEQIIEIEVKANVEYSTDIAEDCKSWISSLGTKALSSEKMHFKINENKSDDVRQGVIEVKQNNGSMSGRIEIIQTPIETINVESQISSSVLGGSISVPFKSNTEIKASTSDEWIHIIETKGEGQQQLVLTIDSNTMSTKAREGTVSLVGIREEAKAVIRVIQDGAEEGVLYTTRYGELSSILSSCQTDTITTLKIKGYLDSIDFVALRQISSLKYLDIYDVICKDDRLPSGAFCYVTAQSGKTNIKYTESSAKLVKIVFPKGLKTIGTFAFYHSESLVGKLVLPNSLETIESVAFADCVLLNGKLQLPESLKYIGESAFSRCSFSGDLIIPPKVEYIGDYAFKECKGFTSLKLSENLKYLGGESFIQCTSMVGDLTIPAGIERIEWRTFYLCSFDGVLNLPSGLKKIYNEAFYSTHFTGALILPDGLDTIEEGAFEYNDFTSISIPNTIKTWGDVCFAGCRNIKGEVKLPENMTRIPRGLFVSCEGINSIKFPDNVSIISDIAFSNCSGLSGTLEIPEGVVLIEYGAFSYSGRNLEKIILPNSLQTIQELGMYAGTNPVIFVKWDDPIPYSNQMLDPLAEVQVPSASVSKYQSAEGWKNHKIVGY